ncbi:MAG: polysaccharide deacetylase family protein [Beijerinckiaceae bacterium]
MRHALFRAGLSALSATGLSRLMRPLTCGLGAVLMFHHVRPYAPKGFDPNRGLEITPEFLDATLTHVRARGYDIIALDALPERLANPRPEAPFVVLTFDDGYRDIASFALPVLKRHNAPFTLFATTGFAEGSAPLWWLDLADAIASGRPIEIEGKRFAPRSDAERMAAFKALYSALSKQPLPTMIATINRLAHAADIDTITRLSALCLDWQGLSAMAAEPLCTIGAHTLTHPLLGTLGPEEVMREMAQSRAILEDRLQRSVQHFAYPAGDPHAAGIREFRQAKSLGFSTAMTTRPGVLYAGHTDHLQALPRLSVNGWHQSITSLDVLLSGAAFFLLNQGRKLNVG